VVVENPTWGAPRIHGELLMLGFDVSERTISRWMNGHLENGASPALALPSPYHGTIAAMDFFTVSDDHLQRGSIAFFVISHDRRRILHFNVTKHPDKACGSSSSCEKHSIESAPRFVILIVMPSMDWKSPQRSIPDGDPVRTSFESPWQE